MNKLTGMRSCARMMRPALLLAAFVLLFCACTATPEGSSAVPGETAAWTESAIPGTAAWTEFAIPETAAWTESAAAETEEAKTQLVSSTEASTEKTEEAVMKLRINDIETEVLWEDNESVAALRELVKTGPLTVQMSPYGGFEQVGPLGQSLPRDDSRITTQAGDIVLYSGNQIVVFYGSNTWAYTKLGHIMDKSAQELAELLGSGDVTITIGKGL